MRRRELPFTGTGKTDCRRRTREDLELSLEHVTLEMPIRY